MTNDVKATEEYFHERLFVFKFLLSGNLDIL